MSAWKALYVIPLVGISLAATAETKVDYIYEKPEVQSDTTGHKVIELRGYHKEDGEKSWRKTNAREMVIMTDEKAKTVTIKYLNSKFESEEKVFTGIDFNNDVWLTNSSVITKDLADKMLRQDEVVYASRYLDNGKKVNVVLLPTLEVNVVKLEELEPKPLYVVDGIPMDSKFNIESIKPEEIKEITVLKDDNAAGKYGEAAKDGVIEITLKKGDANEEKPAPDIYINSKKAIPFQQVAQKPGFNGGDANEFSKYVAQNVVYPESCRQSKIEGRVTLEFTVTETGEVGDIRILRSVNSDLDREAVRVVAQSPTWTPGRDENGKVVSVKYTFPVIFKLPDSENK